MFLPALRSVENDTQQRGQRHGEPADGQGKRLGQVRGEAGKCLQASGADGDGDAERALEHGGCYAGDEGSRQQGNEGSRIEQASPGIGNRVAQYFPLPIPEEEKYTHVGVAVYALMAAGGDMGAAVAPQMVGILSDKFSLTDLAFNISETLHIGTEQVGMRAGLLVAALFPIAGAVCVLCMKKHFKNRDAKKDFS